MKILLAPDKFKGTLSADKVCQALTEGIALQDPSIEVVSVPMADGGEGTSRILTSMVKGEIIKAEVSDPLGRRITTEFGLSQDGKDAFIEMASASGLSLLKLSERNPAYTSSVGTGELIMSALSKKPQRIVMGIGGSATNDAGIGMANALGVKFYGRKGELVFHPKGKDLCNIEDIDMSGILPAVRDTEFLVLSDVVNPLVGDNGATNVFGAQKGADTETITALEAGMTKFAHLMEKKFRKAVNFPGAGAAGGMGAGAAFFLNARIISGAEFIIQFADADRLVSESDLVISGEGKADKQTLSGKLVAGIAMLCKKHRKRFWVVAGKIDLSVRDREYLGIETALGLVDSGIPEDLATGDTYNMLRNLIASTPLKFHGEI
jgi:glycerate 2-kinase